MYKIAKTLNLEGIETSGVYIASRENHENQLAKYREKKPLWSNVAVGRILENEQYTGTMIYNRFKSENVGDKHARLFRKKNGHVWRIVMLLLLVKKILRRRQLRNPEIPAPVRSESMRHIA